MTYPHVDTDVLIRLLTGDDPAKQAAAAALFEQVESGTLMLTALLDEPAPHEMHGRCRDSGGEERAAMEAPRPDTEAARLAALRRYAVLDTAPEPVFDELARLAAQLCGTPMALISLVDAERQWFKATLGVEFDETPRAESFCAHAILQAEPLVIPDTLADARFAANPAVTAAPHIRFYAGAPLLTPEGHALGTLCVLDSVPRLLAPEQGAALAALAHQVITELELRQQLAALRRAEAQHRALNAKLELRVRQRIRALDVANLAKDRVLEQEQRLRGEAEALAEISRRISASLDPDQVLQAIVEAAHDLVHADMSYIGLPDALGALHIAALVGNRSDAFQRLVIPPGTGVGGRVMATGQPCQVHDYASETTITHDRVVDQAVVTEGVSCSLALPIQRGDTTAGVFWVVSRSLRRFNPDEVGLLERLAAQAAAALENAHAYAREREARREVEALLAATAALGAQAEPEAVLRTLVEQTAALLEADIASYALAVDGRVVVPAFWRSGAWLEDRHEVLTSGSLISRVWRTRLPVRSNDLASELDSNRAFDARYSLQSQLAAPLLAPDGERLGLVSLFNSRRVAGFNARDEEILLAICQHGGAILRRAHDTAKSLAAQQEAARRGQEVAALLTVAERLSVAASTEAVFRCAVEASVEMRPMRLVSIATNEGDHALSRYRWVDGEWQSHVLRLPLDQSISGWVIAHAQSYRSDDLGQDRFFHSLGLGVAPHTRLLSVPVLGSNGNVLAVIHLFDRLDGRPFSDEDQRLAEGVAHHVAVALERTRFLAELRRSEERYRDLFENANDLIYTYDLDGRFTSVNRIVAQVTGYTREELLQLRVRDIVCPEYTGLMPELRARLLAGQPLSPFELEILTKDGRRIWLQTNPRPLHEAGRLAGVQGIARDITERKRFEEDLHRLAYYDPLTGLPNRAHFLERLSQAITAAGRRPSRVSVLFLDLDGFKHINDSLGHAKGDILLRAVGQRLTTSLRPGDTLARFGGDEFAVLLDADFASDARRVAGCIVASLRPPFVLDGREFVLTASIGIAESHRQARQPTAEEFLRQADIAMYRAKAAGKAQVEVFRTEMGREAVARLALESDLRRALERSELRLAYQPIVALASGAVVGVEALARWQHPQRGLIPPATFIPLAEETGLILPLGRWVLTEACRQAQAWQALRPAGSPLCVSVNLSARQFQTPDLAKQVAQALQQTGLDPANLELELTESVLMQEAEATTAGLQALTALGVRLAIDDFGTGYSSLSYLQRFSVNTLKVDRSFVSRVAHDTDSKAIVQAVLALAQALRMRVIAEGIETPAQLACLRALGCELGQGYYFAQPLPGETLNDLLQNEGLGFGLACPLKAGVQQDHQPAKRRAVVLSHTA